jgi:hypothetical protein
MLNTPLSKGSFPNRSEACLIIASELRRMGKDKEMALNITRDWNKRNINLLKDSEIRSANSTAYRRNYNYSCHNQKIKEFCIGEEFCTFSNYVKSDKKPTSNSSFFDFGWQKILSNAAKDVYYLGLIQLEIRKGVGFGGLIIANQTEIGRYAGITPKSVRKALQELQRIGLIEYKAGSPRIWEGKASQIRRIIPIPKPTKELLKRIEK